MSNENINFEEILNNHILIDVGDYIDENITKENIINVMKEVSKISWNQAIRKVAGEAKIKRIEQHFNTFLNYSQIRGGNNTPYSKMEKQWFKTAKDSIQSALTKPDGTVYPFMIAFKK